MSEPSTPSFPKRGRPKDEELPARRRAEIVTHAITEFARSGFANADLERVAAHAGCSKGTLYNYFASKVELFSACVDSVMRCVKNQVEVDEQADPIDQLERVVQLFLRNFSENPEFVELVVQERSAFRDREEPAYVQYRAASREQWRRRFERLTAEGRMRPMSTDQAFNILGDLMWGTIYNNYFRGRKVAPEQQAREIVEIFLGGILTASGYQQWLTARTVGLRNADVANG